MELGWSDEKSNPKCWLEKTRDSESLEDLFEGKGMKTRVRVKASVVLPRTVSFISCTVFVPERRGMPTA